MNDLLSANKQAAHSRTLASKALASHQAAARHPGHTHHQGLGGRQHAAPCPHVGPGGQGLPPAAAAGTGPGHRGGHRLGAEAGGAQRPRPGQGVAAGAPGPGPAGLLTGSDGSDALGAGGGRRRPWNSWAEKEKKQQQSAPPNLAAISPGSPSLSLGVAHGFFLQ